MGVVAPANKDNFICASACFLIYAGGVQRGGDFLVLHRPYFSKNAARNMSDVEQETAQKQLMAKVGEYLQTMEVDQFYIDKMMSTNSQDGYALTGNDVVAHPLDIIVPSIEEIILTKCDIVTMSQIEAAQKDTTLEGRQRWTKLNEQWIAVRIQGKLGVFFWFVLFLVVFLMGCLVGVCVFGSVFLWLVDIILSLCVFCLVLFGCCFLCVCFVVVCVLVVVGVVLVV